MVLIFILTTTSCINNAQTLDVKSQTYSVDVNNDPDKMGMHVKSALKDSFSFVKGYGENQPIIKNDSEKNRQKNRRVEIVVIPF